MAGSEVLPEGLNVVNEKLYALSPILVPLCSNVAECNGAFEISSTHELSLFFFCTLLEEGLHCSGGFCS